MSLLLTVDQQMHMRKISKKRKEHTQDPKERTIPRALTGPGGPHNVINGVGSHRTHEHQEEYSGYCLSTGYKSDWCQTEAA